MEVEFREPIATTDWEQLTFSTWVKPCKGVAVCILAFPVGKFVRVKTRLFLWMLKLFGATSALQMIDPQGISVSRLDKH